MKIQHTKNQQSTEKASEHNRCIVFLRALVFCTHQQKWRQLSFIICPILVLLSHNFLPRPFSPLPPPPPNHAADIINHVSVITGVAFPSPHPSASAVALVRETYTGTSHCCCVGLSCQRWQRTLLILAGVPDSRSPNIMMPPPLSLLNPLSHPPQATLRPCPHGFRRSPIRQPQNFHCPRRRTTRHTFPHRRRHHLDPHPRCVC